jgi:hypothetical protein
VHRPLLWAAAAILVAFLYDPTDLPLQGDAGGQLHIAERAASGVPPHASSINAKNGLGFLMPAAAIRAGRVLGIADVYAVRVYGILLLAVSVALVWLVASGIAGRRPADLAALAVLAMPAYMEAGVVGVQPKLPLVAFLLLAGLAAGRERWFTAGGAAAAAFLCWQPALVAVPAAFIPLVLDRPHRRDSVRFAVGVLVVIAVYEAYFVDHGLLLEQLSQAFVLPARFMSGHRPGLAESLYQLAENIAGGLRLAALTVPLAALWAVRYWRGVVLRRREFGRTVAAFPALAYWQLGGVAFALFTIAENQGRPDLFVLIPFLALGAGIVLANAATRSEVGRRVLPWLKGAIVGLLIAGVFLGPLVRGPVKGITLADQRALAHEVGDLAEEEEGVFALSATHLLLALERRDNWNRYGHFYRGMSEYLIYRYGASFDVLRHDGRLPGFVLVSRPRWLPRRLKADLASRYQRVSMTEFERQEITVYRLQESRNREPDSR